MTARWTLPPVPDSVPRARSLVLALLDDADSSVRDSVQLMVSELATNCVLHARSDFVLEAVRGDGQVRVEVTDSAGGTAQVLHPSSTEDHGRGLQIVSALADAWGVDVDGDGPGKTVWFSVALTPQG